MWTQTADEFPTLFEICVDQHISVAKMAERRWQLRFRRWLDADRQMDMNMLQSMLCGVALNNEKDMPRWK